MKSRAERDASMLSTSCPSMVREATSRANDTVGANTYCPPLQLGDSGRMWHHDKMLLKSNENHRVLMGNWELPSKMVVICLTNYYGRPIIMQRLITKTIDFNGEHSTSKSLGLKKTKRGFDQHMICAFYRKIWELMNDFFSICSRKVGGTWPAQIDDATQQM